MRLIDADEFESYLINRYGGNDTGEEIIEDLHNQPTITPDMAQVLAYECGKAERKRGRWVKVGQSFLNPNKFRNYSCSECGYDIEKVKLNYCPNCGAEMRKGEEE